ncbi:MAG: hypothetical protein RDV41_10195, partial [Planctomycetota bacterium]|nr:hypothetical protein [Planctomycetota bacterium]
EITAPRHVQVGEKGYIGVNLPSGTPANGHMKFQIKHGKGVGSLRKTNLHQIPQQNVGGNPPGNGGDYDFVYEVQAAAAGALTFDSIYECVASPSDGGGGNNGEGETTSQLVGATTTLNFSSYSIVPLSDLVEAQPVTVRLEVQPPEAVIINADWRFFSQGLNQIYAEGVVQSAEFQLSQDGTKLVAQRTFIVPTGIAGLRDLYFAGTAYLEGSGGPGFPTIEMVRYMSEPIAVLPGGGVAPLTVEIGGGDVIVNVIEGQPLSLSVTGTTPDFWSTQVIGILSDSTGVPLQSCTFWLTDLGGGHYLGTATVQIPMGTGGQTLFIAVLATCPADPAGRAIDSARAEVIPATTPPVTLTLSAPYGTTITEGLPAKFKCTFSPLEALGRLQDFSYCVAVFDIGFSQIVRLDPKLFVPAGDVAECEFEVIMPPGTIPVSSMAGVLVTRAQVDFTTYVSNNLDVTVLGAAPPVEPPRFAFIASAPVILREACETTLEFTISDGDPNALLQALDAITFGILDPATGEEVAHFNIDPRNPTSVNSHLYYRWFSPPVPVGLAGINGGTGVAQLVPRLVISGEVIEYPTIEVRIYPEAHILLSDPDYEIVAGQEEAIAFVIAPAEDLELSHVACGIFLMTPEGPVKPSIWRARVPGEELIEGIDAFGRRTLEGTVRFAVPIELVPEEITVWLDFAAFAPVKLQVAEDGCVYTLRPGGVPLPSVSGLNPSSGLPLTIVTVTGTNFRSQVSENKVLLVWPGVETEVDVLSANTAGTELTFVVPVEATGLGQWGKFTPPGPLEVRVKTPSGTSNSVWFTVLSSSSSITSARDSIAAILAAGGISNSARQQLQNARQSLDKASAEVTDGKADKALKSLTQALEALLRAQRFGANTGELEKELIRARAAIVKTWILVDVCCAIVDLMKTPGIPVEAWNRLLDTLKSTEKVLDAYLQGDHVGVYKELENCLNKLVHAAQAGVNTTAIQKMVAECALEIIACFVSRQDPAYDDITFIRVGDEMAPFVKKLRETCDNMRHRIELGDFAGAVRDGVNCVSLFWPKRGACAITLRGPFADVLLTGALLHPAVTGQVTSAEPQGLELVAFARDADLSILGCASALPPCSHSEHPVAVSDKVSYLWKIEAGGGLFTNEYQKCLTAAAYYIPPDIEVGASDNVKISLDIRDRSGHASDRFRAVITATFTRSAADQYVRTIQSIQTIPSTIPPQPPILWHGCCCSATFHWEAGPGITNNGVIDPLPDKWLCVGKPWVLTAGARDSDLLIVTDPGLICFPAANTFEIGDAVTYYHWTAYYNIPVTLVHGQQWVDRSAQVFPFGREGASVIFVPNDPGIWRFEIVAADPFSPQAGDTAVTKQSTRTACKIDLTVIGLPETREETHGGFISANDDDDNENQALDNTEAKPLVNPQGAAVTDDELKLMRIAFLPDVNYGTITLKATAGLEKLNVWKFRNNQWNLIISGNDPIETWDLAVPAQKQDVIYSLFYAEGRWPSGTLRDIKLEATYVGSKTRCKDKVSLTIMKMDILMDDVLETEEQIPGAFIGLNKDHDNGNLQVADKTLDGPIPAENDLRRFTLRLFPADLETGEVKLDVTAGGAKVKIWASPQKGGTPVALPCTWPIGVTAPDPVPWTLYMEGFEPSGAMRDVALLARYERPAVGTTAPARAEDLVKITVVETDVVVAGVPEFEEMFV